MVSQGYSSMLKERRKHEKQQESRKKQETGIETRGNNPRPNAGVHLVVLV